MFKDSLPSSSIQLDRESDTASEIIMINDDSKVNEMCCFVLDEKALAAAAAAAAFAAAERRGSPLPMMHVRLCTNFCVRQHKNIIIVQLCMHSGVGWLL